MNMMFLSLFSMIVSPLEAKVPSIKVLVKKSMSKVYVQGTDLKRKFYFNNQVNHFPGRKEVKFNCDKLRGRINFDKPQMLASLNSKTGLVTLGKQKYRGHLHILTARNNKSCDVVYETSLTDYLSSLLTKEMNAAWPLEALKAQAVAARTYALHKINSKQVSRDAGYDTFYHLENSEKHQVAGEYFDATIRTRQAARETKGHVLLNTKGNMDPLFFHASCGGRTLEPQHVWQNEVDGYKSVPCPRCHKRNDKNFSKKITQGRFINFLKWAQDNGYINKSIAINLKSKIYLLKDYPYGRKLRVYVDHKSVLLKKSFLRRFFGRFMVPSNNFKISKKGKSFFIKGKGHGHGVGMCQLGALELAKKGWSYKKILAHYFPNHSLVKVY